jgi:hypothetical protein
MPENGQEKFWDADKGVYNWEGHAREAEFNANRAQPKQEPGQETIPPAPTGIDFPKYSDEFAQLGYLTEESYEELEAQNVPRQVVDQYIEGAKATVSEFRSHAHSLVGGEQNYTAMAAWAKQNVSAQDQAIFNADVEVPGDAADAAIKGLFARYLLENGMSANYVEGGGGSPVSSADGYGSQEQMMEDMSKKEYKQDPSFRAMVKEKVRNSPHLSLGQGKPRMTASVPVQRRRG